MFRSFESVGLVMFLFYVGIQVIEYECLYVLMVGTISKCKDRLFLS